MATQTKAHWERIYQSKAPVDLTWHQDVPALSLELIGKTAVSSNQTIIDIGSGASSLTKQLADAGFTRLIAVDLSATALQHAQERLGKNANAVEWIQADITTFEPDQKVHLWHDRAVFHFLTEEADRVAYLQTLNNTLHAGGHFIVATFAIDGPEQCSGLDIIQYDADTMAAEVGEQYILQETCNETHRTPWGGEQQFTYFWFQKQIG